ncbi:hypothetical protein BDZ97DRAFT_1916272 [Flammula alnicola]|nr:hypothetical protein BDZ97DRAFT_1916272 [Flammula alnicola]
MTTPTPVVPFDVIEVILDILAWDYNEPYFRSLEACSLTCHSFLPLCRKRIFASIKVNGTYSRRSNRTNMLSDLLTTAPDIADYVRELHFGITNDDEEYFNGLPEILRRLTNLNSLHLFHHGSGKLDWKGLALPIKDAMACLMSLPTLTSLDLSWIANFPVSALISCTHLQDFHIDFVDIAEIDDTPHAMLPVASILLEGYSFGYEGAIGTKKILEAKHSDGQSIFAFTDLKVFSADCRTLEDMDIPQTLLRRTRQLTRIILHIRHLSFFGLARSIAPSINTLKKLILHINVDSEHTDPLSGLCAELEEMAGRNVLEYLEICVDVEMDMYCKTGDEWGMLDKVLSKSGWSALKRVWLDVVVRSRRRRKDDYLVGVLGTLPQRQFPILSCSKTIDFIFEAREDHV